MKIAKDFGPHFSVWQANDGTVLINASLKTPYLDHRVATDLAKRLLRAAAWAKKCEKEMRRRE